MILARPLSNALTFCKASLLSLTLLPIFFKIGKVYFHLHNHEGIFFFNLKQCVCVWYLDSTILNQQVVKNNMDSFRLKRVNFWLLI